MDSRFIRPPSPGSRRYGASGRSSTGNLDLRDYESYYSNPRSSRDSITSGARLSSERLAPRSAPRVHRETLPLRRNPDDYAVAPRRIIGEHDPPHPLSRRPLNVVTTNYPDKYQPVISSAVEKSSGPYVKVRPRDDDTTYIVPASSIRHHRHNSAGSSAYLAANRDRERDRGEKGGYRSSNLGKSYYNNQPPVRPPKDPYDSDYGYEYTNRTEQAYRDTEPRPRVRRGSDTGVRERPHSITGLEDYYARQPVASRDAGPPVSMRGFSKIDQNGSTRHEYRYPREAGQQHRDSSLTRGSRGEDEGLSRRRSNRAPVSLHQDSNDGYSSNMEERNRHKHRNGSRKTESIEKDSDRGLGIRYQENDAKREDEKSRREYEKARSESEDRYRHHRRRRDDSEERPRHHELRRDDRDEDSERERRPRVERDDRERKHRHDHDEKDRRHHHDVDERDRRSHESRKDKQDGSRLGEGVASLGAAGAAAAAGLVAEKSRHRHDKDQSDLDSEVSPRDKHHHRRGQNHISKVLDPDESSGRSEDTDEERRERHRRRRKEREGKEDKDGKSRGAELIAPVIEAHSRSHDRKPYLSSDPRSDDREPRSRRHRGHDKDPNLTPGSEDSIEERVPREMRAASHVRVISPAKSEEPKPKGILRPPREKFPEDPAPVREGVAPLKDAGKKGIPPNARWTKIDRRLVNPEALEAGNERYEQRPDYVIVLRVLTKEEIEKYATLTQAIRDERSREAKRAHMLALEDSKYDDESDAPKRLDDHAHNPVENEPTGGRSREGSSQEKLQLPSASTSNSMKDDPNRPDLYPGQSYQRERPPEFNHRPGTYPPSPNNLPVPSGGGAGSYAPSPAHSAVPGGGPYAAPPMPQQGQMPGGGVYGQQQPPQQPISMPEPGDHYPSQSAGYQGGSTSSLPTQTGSRHE